MKTLLFTPASRSTVNWASGTSTEIFIYPADGSFATRDFRFRISTATVEAEASTFTFFEGITRHLMILKGELELTHEGRYTKHLKPYDQDTFSGEWATRSKGKVTDFNLMLKGSTSGTLAHRSLSNTQALNFHAAADFNFIYLASGSVVYGGNLAASEGDLLQLEAGTTLRLSGTAELVEIQISLD